MKKKIILGLVAMAVVVGGVAGMSAWEAHIINVTAHIENALTTHGGPLHFGTVFPQEYLLRDFSVKLSSSFLAQNPVRVNTVDYKIVQKPKCICNAVGMEEIICKEGEYAAVDYATHECPRGYDEMLSLCPFLSKLPDWKDDMGVESYFQGDHCLEHDGSEVAYGSLWIGDKETGGWTVDLKVPPVDGYVGQDWPAGCPTVAEDSQDYGCDLWIEVTDIYKAEALTTE